MSAPRNEFKTWMSQTLPTYNWTQKVKTHEKYRGLKIICTLVDIPDYTASSPMAINRSSLVDVPKRAAPRPTRPLIFHMPISLYVSKLTWRFSLQQAWVWLLWLLSQTWITLHIWTPKAERLATTERLFVLPMYDSLLIDQSLGLNRRCDDEADVKTEVPVSNLSWCFYIVSWHFPVIIKFST